MSQWSNFLGTDASVLELGLAVASVGGGGYIGGRVTSLSRMRTEDRRRLVDERQRLSNHYLRGRFLTGPRIWFSYLSGRFLPASNLEEASPRCGGLVGHTESMRRHGTMR